MAELIKLPHNRGTCDQHVLHELPQESTIKAVSDAMKQLGDPSRLRIFWLLCHTEECVINIAAIMDMSSPAVSHHLRLLKNAGLIESERHGKEMYYRATKDELTTSLHHIIEEVGRISCPK
jgi:DNA-binding transcriptional ArsR family regulator